MKIRHWNSSKCRFLHLIGAHQIGQINHVQNKRCEKFCQRHIPCSPHCSPSKHVAMADFKQILLDERRKQALRQNLCLYVTFPFFDVDVQPLEISYCIDVVGLGWVGLGWVIFSCFLALCHILDL